MSKAVVPVSGGLDSAVILSIVARAASEIYAITFDYGQKHRKEIQFAGFQLINYDTIEQHKILDIQFFKKIKILFSVSDVGTHFKKKS